MYLSVFLPGLGGAAKAANPLGRPPTKRIRSQSVRTPGISRSLEVCLSRVSFLLSSSIMLDAEGWLLNATVRSSRKSASGMGV